MSSPALKAENTLSPDALVSQLNWRYATKQYDPTRIIPDNVWNALEQSLVLSPSSFGLQPWKFVVVKDKALREKLKGASWGQGQVVDASHLVVFAAQKDMTDADVDRFIRSIADTRKVSVESLAPYRGMMAGFAAKARAAGTIPAWAARQVYIALGTLLTSAAVLGVDATPMEGLDPKAYDELLGLEKTGFQTCVVATLGYRAQSDAYAALVKVRYPKSELVSYI